MAFFEFSWGFSFFGGGGGNLLLDGFLLGNIFEGVGSGCVSVW